MTVAVDLADLIEAMEDGSATLNYFLDLETGEVVLVSESLGFIEAGYQRLEMAESPGRYVAVPPISRSEFSGDLEAFIDCMSDDDLAERLEEALDEPDPRKRVEAMLESRPDVDVEWKAFRKRRTTDRATAFLASVGSDLSPG